LDACMHMVF